MKNERFSIKLISARRIFVVGYVLCSFIEVSVSLFAIVYGQWIVLHAVANRRLQWWTAKYG